MFGEKKVNTSMIVEEFGNISSTKYAGFQYLMGPRKQKEGQLP